MGSNTVEGTTYYVHNVGGIEGRGIVDPDRRALVIDRLVALRPAAFMLSEAYPATDVAALNRTVRELQDVGYMIARVAYSEPGRPDQHGMLAGALRERNAGLTIMNYAGRLGLHIDLTDPASGYPVYGRFMHANDRAAPRKREIAALLDDFPAGEAAVLGGSLNTAIPRGVLLHGLHVIGRPTRLLARFEAIPGEPHPSLPRRGLSLLNRVSAQLDGEEIEKIIARSFVNADLNDLHTALVPTLKPGLNERLAQMALIGPAFSEPQTTLDYLYGRRGDWRDYTRHELLEGDDHTGISATFTPNVER